MLHQWFRRSTWTLFGVVLVFLLSCHQSNGSGNESPISATKSRGHSVSVMYFPSFPTTPFVTAVDNQLITHYRVNGSVRQEPANKSMGHWSKLEWVNDATPPIDGYDGVVVLTLRQ